MAQNSDAIQSFNFNELERYTDKRNVLFTGTPPKNKHIHLKERERKVL